MKQAINAEKASPEIFFERHTTNTSTSNASNEYSKIQRLLADMSTTMASSVEQIHNINLTMRMISFNSKIEAVRAGEAGKAFAVVSGEMKSLSDKTTIVTDKMRNDTSKAIEELKTISNDIATNVRGTRLSDLALTNIDLIDRNLYERSCDVRWWATDSSLVDALAEQDKDALAFASKRLGIILNAYTVYFDLILCNDKGEVVARGRPGKYRGNSNQTSEPWFRAAMNSASGDDYGFQTVHASPLVDRQRALIYSAAVREGGKTHGKILGALGIVFNYDNLAQVLMISTPVGDEMKDLTRVCITDDKGLVLADSANRILAETLHFPGMEKLYKQDKGFIIEEINARRYCIAHARAPGYETYSTGWHSLILQQL
ncbi:MAG: methyl-accepting chemotaxis protein [Pseudomonadota bacterium]